MFRSRIRYEVNKNAIAEFFNVHFIYDIILISLSLPQPARFVRNIYFNL